MIEGVPVHEPTAAERDIIMQLMRYREGVLHGNTNVRKVCWAEIDNLLDELNTLGRVALEQWPTDDMGNYLEREV